MVGTNKRRRPARPAGNRATTINLTLRLAPMLLEQLRLSAAQNQRSIAAEAQRRLAQPEINDIAKMVALAVSAQESRLGKSWQTDAESRYKCRMAAEAVLDLLLDDISNLNRLARDTQIMVENLNKVKRSQADDGAMAAVEGQFKKIIEFLEARSVAVDAIVGGAAK